MSSPYNSVYKITFLIFDCKYNTINMIIQIIAFNIAFNSWVASAQARVKKFKSSFLKVIF